MVELFELIPALLYRLDEAFNEMVGLPEARAAARRALQYFQTPDSSTLSEERAHVLRLWSQVELAQGGKMESAIEGLRQSIHLFGSLGNQVEQARSQVILSAIMLANGDSTTAQSLSEDARHVFQRLGAQIDLQRMPVI